MKKPFKITPDEREKIIELLKKKRSIKEVARECGRSRRPIIKIAKDNGIKVKGSPIGPKEEEEIIVLLKEKKNASEVARIVGRGVTPVLAIAVNHGIALTQQLCQLHKKEKENILQLLKEKRGFMRLLK